MDRNPGINFDKRPYVATWQTSPSCDLACIPHAADQPGRDPLELTTDDAKRLIDEIAAMRVPVFVLSGGHPLKRPDIFELVRYAAEHKVRISLTPSATPLLTRENIVQLKDCGLARLAVSLDGPTAEIHDAFRGVKGSYEWTLNAVKWARQVDLPLQVITTITRHNLSQLDDTINLLTEFDITLWTVFFQVPTGRRQTMDFPSAEEFEQVFQKLYEASRRVMFDIRSTEAPHYRRFLLQRRTESRRQRPAVTFPRVPEYAQMPTDAETFDGMGRAPGGINDGKGVVFISHLGEVFPGGFLPVSGGDVRKESLAEIYRNSLLFRSLRDSKRLEGKCGRCEFRELCGGSRARAYMLTGNMFAEEPCCLYEPKQTAKC